MRKTRVRELRGSQDVKESRETRKKWRTMKRNWSALPCTFKEVLSAAFRRMEDLREESPDA